MESLEDGTISKMRMRCVIQKPLSSEVPRTERKLQPLMDNLRRCRSQHQRHHSPVRQVAHHNLTHVIYRPWCPHCVMKRKPAAQHRSQPNSKCNVSIFCTDCAFVRYSPDEELATLHVGWLYPSRSIFATVADSKGVDDTAAIQRRSSFFKESGIWKPVHKTDQESSIKVMVDDALRKPGRSGVFEAYE